MDVRVDFKESWAPKNWCFWTVVLEKTLESPLDCREIQPVHPKGHQSWIFIGRTVAKAEALILWPPDVENRLIGKDSDAGRDWRQEEKGMAEDEMAGWHHWLDGHEFELVPGIGDGQVSLACCIPWGHKELNTTAWLNWIQTLNIEGLRDSVGEGNGNPLQCSCLENSRDGVAQSQWHDWSDLAVGAAAAGTLSSALLCPCILPIAPNALQSIYPLVSSSLTWVSVVSVTSLRFTYSIFNFMSALRC